MTGALSGYARLLVDLVGDQHGLWVIGLDIGLLVEVTVQAGLIDGILPLADHDGGDTVADQVGQRSRST